jgi:succinyl-diaminopimelate desuccinylase
MTLVRDELIEFTKELIRIPTVNPPGTHYTECITVIKKKCNQLGLETAVVECDGLPALIGGDGEGILHFHGHYDVVGGDEFQFHPFVKNGKLYGRGSSDMKGGLAVMLYALSKIDSPDISFSITGDEETGGMHGLDCLLQEGFLHPQAVLMPEASSNRIWNGCRGAFAAEIRLKGESAHSVFQEEGSNAFMDMIDVVQQFRDIDCNKGSILLGGILSGGTQFNMVPEFCSFSIDWRFSPEQSLSQIKSTVYTIIDQMKEQGKSIDLIPILETEGFYTPPETELYGVIKDAVEHVRDSAVAEICPGFLDIRYFAFQNIPAIAYGPGLLEYAHGPHEYVEIQDLMDAVKIFELVGKKIVG